jgi:UDP-N-acetylglucosamine:LPS N-acetylglucosamine transferase
MPSLVAATNGSLRVLVLTAEEGDGHFATARALTEELLAERPAEVYVWDVFKDGFGRLVPFFSRDAYRMQLRRAPWTYGVEYALFTRFPPTRGIARAGLAALCSRPLLRLIRAVDPDLIVSTHPAVTSVVGHLRRSGELRIPAVATVTDLDAHPFWSHRGVDLHLVVHDACRADVERNAGRGSARVARPIVAEAFREWRPPAEARAALGLPARGHVVLVAGGGWAVGDLEGAVRVTLATDAAAVVCVTGRHEVLRAHLEDALGDEPRVRVLGFTRRMPELLAAADVLVDATVGLTCLEALTCGCRVVVYGAPPGHFRDSAREMARLGLAERARTPAELATALRRALRAAPTRPPLAAFPTAASLIATAAPRAPAIPGWRRRAVPALAGVLATLGFGGFTFASALPYPIIARTFGLEELTAVPTAAPEVGLVIETPEAQAAAIAAELARDHARASFALSPSPSSRTLAGLFGRGDDVLPRLERLKPTDLLAARRRLAREARRLSLGGHFYYLAPDAGFTLAEYVAARSVGGTPVGGAVRLAPRQAPPPGEPRAGAIVVVEADSEARASARAVRRLVAFLRAHGLRPVPLRRLLESAASRSATAGARTS